MGDGTSGSWFCPVCDGTGTECFDDSYESNGNGRLWCPGIRECEACGGTGYASRPDEEEEA